ncbi:MAG: wax ester/triacylglycerol synthase family O-acyltransferase [Pseudomonadales bacterium]|uniref:diacylglycerol O-acyltransferase n=1 Tax=Oleiphilus messinensis TaxID=141451 RepID=A0A1Y0IIC7_9GAMM|nr:wax ester/triacylglycerol synthase family O-acyltransferase [Oleiphilus messinensis]ARU59275.1 acyltransferase, WS/DGAT/MGAT [Oleiphilus messinensis]MCG8609702.1 wax ester/triacylglycerol synthase family O-acyltransferase [Pseudomonadales bacterium]
MKRMNILDASWLAVDSEDTPMHVGNLQIFSMPEGAPVTYLRDEVARMKAACEVVPPWNLKLAKSSRLARILAPAWVVDENIDLDYHVRHSALPKPGGERELGVLISRLHSNHLDFKRPLWECHIIEGLENNRFAMYTKMHHSLIDGISGVRLLQRILSNDPNKKEMQAPWSIGPKKRPLGLADDHVPTMQGAILQAVDAVRAQASSVPKLAGALGRLVSAATQERDELAAPFVGPQSVLNKRVEAQRRFATQQYALDDIKALAKEVDASLNDIVLYLCGSALRRFLSERNCLPDHPLTAGIPVNIRPADDDGTGTAISFMIASLATDVADPLARLETIKESTRTAKEHLQSLPRNALNYYTMLMMSPYILQLLTGLGGRMRPAFNITISNVPGPAESLYYNGAKLEAMYPVSLIAHGGALNITCLSYSGSLNFGYTGCRDTLPSMQNLAVYSGEALVELRQLLTKDSAVKTVKRRRKAG